MAGRGARRGSGKEQFWRRLLRRWRRSGLTIRDFCAEHDVSEPSFYAWRRTIAERERQQEGNEATNQDTPVFVPLNVLPAAAETTFEVVLRHGRSLRVPAGFDAAALRQTPGHSGGGAVMLSLPLPVRIFLCTRHADLRKSFDGLAQLVREHFGADPLSGHLFVFRNKRGDRLKLLYWDSDGYAIWYKRLEVGTFALPAADAPRSRVGEHGVSLRPAELAMLLDGIDLEHIKRGKRYQRPATTTTANSSQ